MPHSCCAPGCTNRRARGSKLQFFSFPLKNEARLKKWLDAMDAPYYKPSKSSRICSEHFTPKDYTDKKNLIIPHLTKDAVPSIFRNSGDALMKEFWYKQQLEQGNSNATVPVDSNSTVPDNIPVATTPEVGSSEMVEIPKIVVKVSSLTGTLAMQTASRLSYLENQRKIEEKVMEKKNEEIGEESIEENESEIHTEKENPKEQENREETPEERDNHGENSKEQDSHKDNSEEQDSHKENSKEQDSHKENSKEQDNHEENPKEQEHLEENSKERDNQEENSKRLKENPKEQDNHEENPKEQEHLEENSKERDNQEENSKRLKENPKEQENHGENARDQGNQKENPKEQETNGEKGNQSEKVVNIQESTPSSPFIQYLQKRMRILEQKVRRKENQITSLKTKIKGLKAPRRGVNVAELEKIGPWASCRLCGKKSTRFVSFYDEEGLRKGLVNKVNKYLPIEVSWDDNYTLKCCWICMELVESWHLLYNQSVRVDKKLRSFESDDEDVGLGSTPLKHAPVADLPSGKNVETPLECNEKQREIDDIFGDFNEVEAMEEEIHKITFEEDQDFDGKMKIEDYQMIEEHVKIEDDWIIEEDQREEEEQKYDVSQSGNNYFNDGNQTHGDQMNVDNGNSMNGNLVNHDEVDSKETVQKRKRILTNQIIKSGNPIGGPYKCEYCSKVFKAKCIWYRHRAHNHPESRNQYSNYGRKLPSKRPQKLAGRPISEFAVNLGDVVQYVCDICKNIFKSKQTLGLHYMIHLDQRPHMCELCGKSFRRKNALNGHVAHVHTKERKFRCEECGKAFVNNYSLKTHLKSHSESTPSICEICGKSFKSNENLKTHQTIHTDLRPFECEICGAAFRRNLSLRRHLVNHGVISNTLHCPECGKVYHIEEDFRQHVRKHEKSTPVDDTDSDATTTG